MDIVQPPQKKIEEETVVIVNKKQNEWTLKEFISFVVITLAIVLPIRIYIAQPFIVSGESMEPTFETGQYLIVDQLSYRFSDLERGDVVVFKLPQNDSNKHLIKRLIGLPGESIKIESSFVYVKKVGSDEYEMLEEDYIKYHSNESVMFDIGLDEYFLMGDNRNNSLDSRFFGPVKEGFIRGKALVRLFPFNKIDWNPGEVEF